MVFIAIVLYCRCAYLLGPALMGAFFSRCEPLLSFEPFCDAASSFQHALNFKKDLVVQPMPLCLCRKQKLLC